MLGDFLIDPVKSLLGEIIPNLGKAMKRGRGRGGGVLAALVPGDLVSLAIGDWIPADVRLVTCSDFTVDESSLTGEPEPILKTVVAIVTSKESLATQEMVNQAFMGTMVVAGRATGLVTATADKTQFGQVFQVRGCPCLLTDIQFSFEQF